MPSIFMPNKNQKGVADSTERIGPICPSCFLLFTFREVDKLPVFCLPFKQVRENIYYGRFAYYLGPGSLILTRIPTPMSPSINVMD